MKFHPTLDKRELLQLRAGGIQTSSFQFVGRSVRFSNMACEGRDPNWSLEGNWGNRGGHQYMHGELIWRQPLRFFLFCFYEFLQLPFRVWLFESVAVPNHWHCWAECIDWKWISKTSMLSWWGQVWVVFLRLTTSKHNALLYPLYCWMLEKRLVELGLYFRCFAQNQSSKFPAIMFIDSFIFRISQYPGIRSDSDMHTFAYRFVIELLIFFSSFCCAVGDRGSRLRQLCRAAIF